MRPACARLALSVLALAGCGDDDAVTPRADAGTDAAVATWEVEPAPPAAPAPPAIGPCPSGWLEVTAEGSVPTCEPHPDGAPAACPAHQAHFPGETGCTTVGSVCPSTGDFAEIPAGRDVIYVLAGATAGDGTIGAPFGTLAEAASATTAGSIIALGRGSYAGEITLRERVELWGACAAETVVTSTSAVGTAGVINTISSGVIVRDLRIENAARPGISAVGRSASVTLDGVIVDGATTAGLVADNGAMITGRDLIVRASRPSAAGDGDGLRAIDGSVALSRAVFEDNAGAGIFAYSASTSVRLEDSVIRGSGDHGAYVQAGASAELAGVLVEGNARGAIADGTSTQVLLEGAVVRSSTGFGLVAGRGGRMVARKTTLDMNGTVAALADDGSEVELEDVVIRETRQNASGTGGHGLDVMPLATATVRRLLVERSSENAIFVAGGGALLTAEDVTVRDVLSRDSDGTHGRGLMMQDGAHASFARFALEACRESAIIAISDGTILEIDDLTVRGTLPRSSDSRFGRAVTLEFGGHATIRRALLTDNLDASVFVNEAGTFLHLEDARVSDTTSEVSSRTRGRGMEVQLGASAELVRAVFERQRQLGVLVSNDAVLSIDHVAILDTDSQESDGLGGRGLNVQVRSSVTGSHLALEANREVGVFVAGEGASAVLTDVRIVDTRGSRCAESPGCTGSGFGMGLGVYGGAIATLTGFEIVRSEVCGVHLENAMVDLHRGTVREGAIGACVQVDGYDLGRLQDDVTYVDNGTNLDATSLPVPPIAM